MGHTWAMSGPLEGPDQGQEVQIKDKRWVKLVWIILNNDFNHSLSLSISLSFSLLWVQLVELI